jgi:hypothetical protein
MPVAATQNSQYDYLDRAFAGQYQAPPVAKSTPKIVTADGTSATENPNPKEEVALFGKDGFGFDDFLDIINPLQHLPVISNIYRELTGDELSPGSRMIGGGIFGGGVGLAASVVNSAIEAETGKDIGAHVIAMLKDEPPAITDTAIATAAPTVPPIASPAATTLTATAAVTNTAAPTTTRAPAASLLQFKPGAENALQAQQIQQQQQSALPTELIWKGRKPDIQNQISQLQGTADTKLTDAQMARVLGDLKLGQRAGASPTTPLQVKATPPQATAPTLVPANVSDNFEYLDTQV